MDDQNRGQDAADSAPHPRKHIDREQPEVRREHPKKAAANNQEAPNYDDRTNGGRALKTDDLSSANDE